MTYFHVTEDHKVGICKATKGRCPYGANSHFYSREEAEAESHKRLEVIYGKLAQPDVSFIASKSCEEILADKTSNASLVAVAIAAQKPDEPLNNGLRFECYATAEYASFLDASNVIAFSAKDGSVTASELVSDSDKDNAANWRAELQSKLKAHYTSIGRSIKGLHINAIYFNDDRNHIIAQVGGSQAYDSVVIKDGNIHYAEAKYTHPKAQLSAKSFKFDNTGHISEDDVASLSYTPKVAKAIRKVSVKATYGHQVTLPLSNKEALESFLIDYKKKQVTSLFLTDKRGALVVIDVSDTARAIDELDNIGYKCSVILRANKNATKLKQEDTSRFVNKFLNGAHPMNGKISAKELEKFAVPNNGNVYFDEYVASINLEDWNNLINSGGTVDFSQIKIRSATLAGEIKMLQGK